jgi:hypothetical protein
MHMKAAFRSENFEVGAAVLMLGLNWIVDH